MSDEAAPANFIRKGSIIRRRSTWRFSDLSRALGLDEISPPLVIGGIGMIGVGLVVPGAHSQAATVLMVLGCGTFIGGALFGRFRQLDIGPSGIRITQEGRATPLPWLSAEAETLNRVALLMLGDAGSARRCVEEALTKVKRYRREIPRADRDATTFRTLIAVLDRVDQERQRVGGRRDGVPQNPAEALAQVAFQARIAYVLRQEVPLREVATILERGEADLSAEIDVAREAYGRYLKGDSDRA